jgi:hypothetical protein
VPDIPAFAQPFVIVLLGLGNAAHHPGDAALTISGKAKPKANPTAFYAFTPTVTHRGDRQLQFTVLNKPSWAQFGKRHGTIYGVPKLTDAGAYPDIVITVSDGESTVQLPAFSINVNPTVAAANSAGPR